MRAIDVPRIVAIGGSAGSFQAVLELLKWLPPDLPAACVLATHLPPPTEHRSILPALLRQRCRLPVAWATDGEPVRAGTLRIAPQGRHLTCGADARWHVEPAFARPWPSVDRLLQSVAEVAGRNAIGVVLSGFLSDGARGADAILEAGGSLLVQGGAGAASMPRHALQRAGAALVLPTPLIGPALVALLTAPGSGDWFRVWPGAAYVDEARERFGLG